MEVIMMDVGLVGWRGMVGTVLLQRMREEEDFKHLNAHFYSTSNPGGEAPKEDSDKGLLKDAFDIETLKKMDMILTCQGGDYTQKIYPELRKAGWKGYWIDAASTLRGEESSVLVLDPINSNQIEKGLSEGKKDFVGANCTVSLMLMGLGDLFKKDLVEWTTAMTYQAASGAGVNHMKELLKQMHFLSGKVYEGIEGRDIFDVDQVINKAFMEKDFPQEFFGHPLAANLLPWIDTEVEKGQSREEAKAYLETNKILGFENQIPIDSTCVRVGALRCHSQALTIKLKKNIPIDEIEDMIQNSHEWVTLVPNKKEETLKQLTPVNVSGKLQIYTGRVRKMLMGDQYLNAFSLGDQLLWGAAEPLRRILRKLLV